MNPTQLKSRTKTFALRVIKLTEAIPTTIAGRAMAAQIVRSGTAVAANYRATCRARSKAEYIARIGVVEEESDETALWLELFGESNLVASRRLTRVLEEANDLTAIMAASRKTASRK